MLLKSISLVAGVAVVLAGCAIAEAGWRTHVTPVYVAAPAPVVYGYWPGPPAYGAYRPVVVAEPGFVPAPVMYGAPVVYPAPVFVRERAFYPGQPVRNAVRAVLP